MTSPSDKMAKTPVLLYLEKIYKMQYETKENQYEMKKGLESTNKRWEKRFKNMEKKIAANKYPNPIIPDSTDRAGADLNPIPNPIPNPSPNVNVDNTPSLADARPNSNISDSMDRVGINSIPNPNPSPDVDNTSSLAASSDPPPPLVPVHHKKQQKNQIGLNIKAQTICDQPEIATPVRVMATPVMAPKKKKERAVKFRI